MIFCYYNDMSLKPIIYTYGDEFYKDLAKKYIRHEQGLFILAPSGVGKTYFCSSQKESHWIDGDDLWLGTGAQPPLEEEYWNQGVDVIERVEQRSDVVTSDAKEQGYWIMGASSFWLRPDAIVIPDWNTHVAYIKHREQNGYDGGMKSDQLEQVQRHISIIKRWNQDHGVPEYRSLKEAIEGLTAWHH
jgi:hypothetical protein